MTPPSDFLRHDRTARQVQRVAPWTKGSVIVTVNIALVTSDALVLGCDSVASTTEYFLDPFRGGVERDAAGKPVEDANGKFALKFDQSDLLPIVTNAWGGVTKMFQIHPSPSPVVAVTAGLAKLQERTIASHAAEFLASYSAHKRHLVTFATICDHFLQFMRREYNAHYKGSVLPLTLREGPVFLVGGFGRDDDFPSLYRVDVRNNRSDPEFVGGKAGVSWAGQGDAVERFIRGYDTIVRIHAEAEVARALRAHSDASKQYITDLVNKILDALGQSMPPGIQVAPPDLATISIDWARFAIPIDYSNLPLQEAISFVSSLAMIQSSRARFARGVATVGGRIHIGTVTKAGGFSLLNEPALTHRYTGFGDDV